MDSPYLFNCYHRIKFQSGLLFRISIHEPKMRIALFILFTFPSFIRKRLVCQSD